MSLGLSNEADKALDWPPVPPSRHFSSHDFNDGRGVVQIFWASEPFWSHDHGEPWILEDVTPGSMIANTIRSVACQTYREMITKEYDEYRVKRQQNYQAFWEHPDIKARAFRDFIDAWSKWRV
jgi:hypothetical protein